MSIVYNLLPHYRFDVFKRIQEVSDLDVQFVAGRTSGDGSIATIPGDLLQKVRFVRNLEWNGFLWQRGLITHILRDNPDVTLFLADSKYLSTWIAAAILRAKRRGVLFWTIGWHRPEVGIRRIYRLAFYRLANRLLLYGAVGRDIGLAMGYPHDRMAIVFNSSSDPIKSAPSTEASLRAFRAKLPPIGSMVATAVIRLNSSKRLEMVIQAASILRTKGLLVDVLLVGEGTERTKLRLLAKALDVPLYLPGPAYGDQELRLVYERTTVTVVPTRAGLTTLQSLKYGIPVITHNFAYEQMPESEAISAGVTGGLYEFGSISSLADVMGRWIERQSRDRDATAIACRAALQANWSASSQAAAIAVEVHRVSKRPWAAKN